MNLTDADKMFALLEPDEARRYFNRRRRIFLGSRAGPISAVSVEIIKKARRRDVKNFVAIFTIETQKRQIKRVAGLADADGKRIEEHRITETLFRAAKSFRHLSVPEPYYYDVERGISFISYIDGKHLTKIVASKKDVSRPILLELMYCVKDLQTIHIKRLAPKIADQPDLAPLKKDLRLLKWRGPSRVKKLLLRWEGWRRWWEQEKDALPRVLAHGDYHPKNIFVLPASAKKRICLIDFGRTHLAPRLWDLAEFLSQFETHPALHLPRGRIAPLQRKTLAAWERVFGPLEANDRKRLAWFKKYFDLSSLAYLLVWENHPGHRQHIAWLYRRI